MSKKVRSYALPIIGGIIGGPIGAGVGAGVNTKLSGGSIGDSLKSAVLGGAGSYVGGNIAGNVIGGPSVASGLQGALGPDLGSFIGQGLGGNIALSPISSLAGSAVGMDLASSLVPQKTKAPVASSNIFSPSRQGEKEAPASLKGAGYLDPMQYGTGIATQGVYGGGAGPEESDYFLNLVNRRLVDDAGNVDKDLSEIAPIENSYLSQLGLGGMSDARSLLEAISKRKAA